MARRTKSDKANAVVPVEDYEHGVAKRVNNPPAGLAHLDRDETPTRTLAYDPHLDPQLVWAGKAERTEVEVPAPSIHVHEELSAENISHAHARSAIAVVAPRAPADLELMKRPTDAYFVRLAVRVSRCAVPTRRTPEGCCVLRRALLGRATG